MPRIALPEPLDLERLLIANSMVASPMTPQQKALDFEAALDAAIEEWERRTKYKPFLASELSSSRAFDPPGPAGVGGRGLGMAQSGGGLLLDLKAGLLRCDSVMLNGVTLQRGMHYWTQPGDALQQGKPFRWLKFARPLYGKPQSLVVTGIWGYCAPPSLNLGTEAAPITAEAIGVTFPADAWNAILRKAALILLPDVKLAYNQATQLVSWSEANVTEKYRDNPFDGADTGWEDAFSKAVTRHRRLTI